MRSGSMRCSSSSSSREGAGPLVEPFRVLNHPSFRFGEASYSPDDPARGPWRTAKSHFRLIFAHDFHLRHMDEPANLPRPWGQLYWVPEALAHIPIVRTGGRHFWIVPKPPYVDDPRLPVRRITLVRDHECVDAAVRIYDEFLLGEDALSSDLTANGRLLISLANRFAARQRARTRA